jgi:putative endonuclease
MSRLIGAKVEAKAVEILKDNKLKIIETNFNTRFGEIDIIALDDQVLVFVEVKYRKSDKYGSASEMLSKVKQRKIIKTVHIYLSKNQEYQYFNYRIDLMAQTGHEMEWIKNAVDGM